MKYGRYPSEPSNQIYSTSFSGEERKTDFSRRTAGVSRLVIASTSRLTPAVRRVATSRH